MTHLEKGIEYTEQNKLVTFGIVPTYAEIGYGYIKASKPLSNKLEVVDIESFIEKPDLEKAKKINQR